MIRGDDWLLCCQYRAKRVARQVFLLWILCWLTAATYAGQTDVSGPARIQTITIPKMERPAAHQVYAYTLLELALELSAEKYGPYRITQQPFESVIGRHLLELESGEYLDVAISMPTKQWLQEASVVRFPIMKGLSSYRLFLTHTRYQEKLKQVETVSQLKGLVIGQGRGWSTSYILEQAGFRVMYASTYDNLFAMFEADRFPLLMRGVFEIMAEAEAYASRDPDLIISPDIAIYTYLPLYFFVSQQRTGLVERISYGLELAHQSGKFDTLFARYFAREVKQLNQSSRRLFRLENSNIDESFFSRDEPYLLPFILRMHRSHQSSVSPSGQ